MPAAGSSGFKDKVLCLLLRTANLISQLTVECLAIISSLPAMAIEDPTRSNVCIAVGLGVLVFWSHQAGGFFHLSLATRYMDQLHDELLIEHATRLTNPFPVTPTFGCTLGGFCCRWSKRSGSAGGETQRRTFGEIHGAQETTHAFIKVPHPQRAGWTFWQSIC